MPEVKMINGNYREEWDGFIRSGDMKALAIIYYGYFDFLYNYGRKFTPENCLIEDSIQNIFAGLIKSRKKLGEVNSVRQYLIVSFRHELFRQIKENRKLWHNVQHDDVRFIPEYSVEDEIILEESQSGVKKALLQSLQNLTSKQKEILFMRFDCRMSYEEISQTLEISVESCRTAIYRSVKSIKSELDKQKGKGVYMFLCFAPILPLIRKVAPFLRIPVQPE